MTKSTVSPFLEGVLLHLQEFAKSAGVKVEDVHVRLTLADGAVVIAAGLKATGPIPAGPTGWGLIEDVSSGSPAAVVVREAHVVKVEFELAPTERRPIGLHSEAGE